MRILTRVLDAIRIKDRNVMQAERENSLIYDFYVKGVERSLVYTYEEIKEQTLAFVASQKAGSHPAEYKYCNSCSMPNIYASAYACMMRSLYDDLKNLSDRDKQEWIEYFNAFQSQDDGLFRDPVIVNDIFEKEDWWGARHLACHLIAAYTDLGGKPKHDFYFLEPFYEPHYVVDWLESRDWVARFDFVGNEVMNYGVLLQYSRDFFSNGDAGAGLKTMKEWLVKHIDANSGLWGQGPFDTPAKLSQGVQGAYHIYPLFFYDKDTIPYMEKIIDNVLHTQNKLGGFGVSLNSSACEDIDSIEPLIRFSEVTDYRKMEIDKALWKAFPWVLSNMNNDGGFVFRRNEGFVYGHPQMSSVANESSMFATWFRTLCLAYLVKYLERENGYCINRCPGYTY